MSMLRDGEAQFCVYAATDENGEDRDDAFEVFDCRAETQVDVFSTEEAAEIACEKLNGLWDAAGQPRDGISYTEDDYRS